jgi:hypothetical protein
MARDKTKGIGRPKRSVPDFWFSLLQQIDKFILGKTGLV